MTEEVTHHYEYVHPAGKPPSPFARVEVRCLHCETAFWLEADQYGHVSDAAHICSKGSWEMESKA